MRKYTPEYITKLPINGIFVYGANSLGLHGSGSARTALELFRARWGKVGFEGRSYGIITKKSFVEEITLEEIDSEILKFILFAEKNPKLKFYTTKIGTARAGFSIEAIAFVFEKYKDLIPDNVILPKEFEFRNETSNSN